MRGGLTTALVALILCAPAQAQDSWDLAKCLASAPAGHLCTPEHLETDLALLTARGIAEFLDPEFQAYELLIRRDPQMHMPNPEATLPDPRTDPTLIQLLHAWAESGLLESEADRGSSWRATETAALKGITSISVTIEDSDSSDDKCRLANDALRLAATSPIIDGGIKVVSDDRVSPALSVNVTALSTGADGCAAFLSVSLRDLPYVTPGDQRATQAVGRKLLEDGSWLTSPRSGFAQRVTEQLRRTVGGFVTQINLAHQTR